MTSQPTPQPTADMKALFSRAAIAYATLAGPLEGMELPLQCMPVPSFDLGTVRIDVPDADHAETLAHRLGLTYETDASGARRHLWSGHLHDQHIVVTGHGTLGTDPDVLRRRARAASRRKIDLLVPSARTPRVIDVTA